MFWNKFARAKSVRMLILVLIIFSLIFILTQPKEVSSRGTLECTIKSVPCAANEFIVFKLSNFSDAHLESKEIAQNTLYPFYTCCKDRTTPNPLSDVNNTILRAAGEDSPPGKTNAHVELPSESNPQYDKNINFTADIGVINCSYLLLSIGDLGFSDQDVCLASISTEEQPDGSTNNHLANCTPLSPLDEYQRKIMCNLSYFDGQDCWEHRNCISGKCNIDLVGNPIPDDPRCYSCIGPAGTQNSNTNNCEYGCGAADACDDYPPGQCLYYSDNTSEICGIPPGNTCSLLDRDDDQSFCSSGSNNCTSLTWDVDNDWIDSGGNNYAGGCCGDDQNEFNLSRLCAFGGCVNDTADDSCCSEAIDCVFNHQCFANSTNLNVYGSAGLEICIDGHWSTQCTDDWVDANNDTNLEEIEIGKDGCGCNPIGADSGKLCREQDTLGDWNGYCAYNEVLAEWNCDPINPWAKYASGMTPPNVTFECKSGEECRDTFIRHSYYQEGTCLDGVLCDITGEIVYDPVDSQFEDNCLDSYNNEGGAPCDNDTSTGGAFNSIGYCRSDDTSLNNSCLPLITDAAANPIAMDCDSGTDSTFNDANSCNLGATKVTGYCDSNAGDACDNTLNGQSPWSQDGTCLTDGSCDASSEVVYDYAFSTFINQCSGATPGSMCDSNVAASGDFTHDGYCLTSGACNLGPSSMNCTAGNPALCELGVDGPVTTLDLTRGNACDGSSNDGAAWSQTGTEAGNNLNVAICDQNGEVAFSSSRGAYVNSCALSIYNGSDACDSSASSGGNFNRDGYCLLNAGNPICEIGITSKNCDITNNIPFNDANTCDANEPLIRGCNANTGDACNNNAASNPSWLQQGTCVDFPSNICDTLGEVAYDRINTRFVSSCTDSYSGAMCDSSATGGDFTHNGYCLNNNNCDISGLVAANCDLGPTLNCEIGPSLDLAYQDCAANPGFACDVDIFDGADWSQNGTCLTDGTCDIVDHVARNSTGDYIASCVGQANGIACDSIATAGGNFHQDAVCTQGICCPQELIDSNDDNIGDFCWCDQAHEGNKCVNDPTQPFNGYCAYNPTASDWVCDEVNPWSDYNSFNLMPEEVSVDCLPGADCRQAYDDNDYTQEGTCISSSPSTCYTGNSELTFDFTNHLVECSSFGANHGGYICDPDATTGGNFSPQGLCVFGDTNLINSCISTGPIAMDCNGGNPNFNVVNTCDLGTDDVSAACSNGNACDSSLNVWVHWSQDGTCIVGNVCDQTGHVAWDGTNFVSDCNAALSGRMCDSTALTGGDFTHNNYCLSDSTCGSTASVAMNCSSNANLACEVETDPTYARCDTQPGAACDSILNDGADWSQTGTCLNDNSCDIIGSTVKNVANNQYLSDCNIGTVWHGSMCDLSAASGANFRHEGYCVMGGSCVAGITSMDCDSGTDLVFNDANTCNLGSDTVSSSCSVTTGNSCDGDSTDNSPWSQAGTCAFDQNLGNAICANTYTVYDNLDLNGARFETDCDTTYNNNGGAMCDSNALIGGDFVQDGYCTGNADGSICDTQGVSVMVCSSNANPNCELGTDPVYLDCSAHAGTSCDSILNDGNLWAQNGTCLSDGTCDTVREVVRVISSGAYVDSCINNNGQECDTSVIGGDYVSEGTCFSPNSSFGVCDLTPPNVTFAQIKVENLNSFDWGHNTLIVNCTGFFDPESDIDEGSYEYQYTLVDDSSNGWTGITGCSGVTNPCLWDTRNEAFLDDENVSVRCRVKNRADFMSTYVQDSFAGIDNINPDLTITSPPEGLDWTDFVNILFEWMASDNKNVTWCGLYLNSSLEWQLDFPQNATIHQYQIPIPYGEYNWQVTCVDIANNTNTSGVRTLRQNVLEDITIEDMDFSGINPRHPEYTTSRAVVLSLKYHNTSGYCVYRNEGENWTAPEACQSLRYWFLTEGNGLKTVYYEIYHNVSIDDNTTTMFYDTINLQQSGEGIDVTRPTAPIVYDDGDYTNVDDRLHARWVGAYDPENVRLGQPLRYQIRIEDDTDGTDVEINGSTAWIEVDQATEIIITDLLLQEDHSYSFMVRVQNFATPSFAFNESSSDGIIVDTTAPSFVRSDPSPENDSWVSDRLVFDIRATDNQEVLGYSYSFTTVPGIVPDSNVEISGTVVTLTLDEFNEGDNWMSIAPVDGAHNVGGSRTYVFHYDPTPPEQPIVENPNLVSNDAREITCLWEQEEDISGIVDYYVEIRDMQDNSVAYGRWTGEIEKSFTTTVSKAGVNYYCRVRSQNGAGLESRFSDESLPTIKPLIINKISPRGYTTKEFFNLKALTSENAKCYYTINSQEKIFEETGKKMHISPLKISDGSEVSASIRCAALRGPQVTNITSFTVDTKLIADEVQWIYNEPYFVSGIGDFQFFIASSGKGIDGYEREDIKVFVDSLEVEDFSIDGESNGLYSLQIMLSDSPGIHKIGIELAGIYNEFEVDLKDVELSISFSGSAGQDSAASENMLISKTGSYQYGVASQGKDASVETSNSGFSIKASPKDSNSYIFMTGTEYDVSLREEYLKNKKFESLKNPSFGYRMSDNYVIDSILGYNNIKLIGDLNLPNGRYSLLIKNLGIDDEGNVILEVTVVNP